MKTFKNVISILAVAMGILFLMNSATDIQLGSGAILIAIGCLGYQR